MDYSQASPQTDEQFMVHSLSRARLSPPRPTNFRVGACLVNLTTRAIVSDGYTLECEGNTHAEQCCLIKLADASQTSEEGLAHVMKEPHAIYTTVEPCAKRLSGNLPCVERILRQKSWIRKVYVGVLEPEKFVGENQGRKLLEDAGIEVVHLKGDQFPENEILKVATAGHVKS